MGQLLNLYNINNGLRMATIKVIFKDSATDGGEGSLYFRIIHKRRMRQIHSGCRIFREEWNDGAGLISFPDNSARRLYIESVNSVILSISKKLNTIVGNLNMSGREYEVEDIVDQYSSPDTVVGFLSYACRLIKDTRLRGKDCTADHYSSALKSFIRYRGEKELPFDELNAQVISGYEAYLNSLNLYANTTSYYMRNLRAIYNHAVEEGLTPQREPFKHVYTGVARTVKRAVSLDIVKALRRLDLKDDPISELARDLFIFSFCTRGMAFVDMAYLRKSNIRNGFLTYRRHKTNRQLNIRWEQSMQDIADRYNKTESEFLFPLIRSELKDYRRQYLSAYQTVSRRLRKLGELLGLTEHLTFHRSRHAWASIARNNNVPLSIITEGMGHDSEKTTRIYLASLDTSAVDSANRKIISLLDK